MTTIQEQSVEWAYPAIPDAYQEYIGAKYSDAETAVIRKAAVVTQTANKKSWLETILIPFGTNSIGTTLLSFAWAWFIGLPLIIIGAVLLLPVWIIKAFTTPLPMFDADGSPQEITEYVQSRKSAYKPKANKPVIYRGGKRVQ